MSTKEKKKQIYNSLSPSVDSQEVAKFTAMAEEWWDPNGKFKPLHKFNPIRIEFIRDTVIKHFNIKKDSKPLSGLSLLDIGCGGGLLSDPMARMGSEVTAIDASDKNIQIAKIHAEKNNININFRCDTAENLSEEGLKFDVIINMEVIEHVADVESFMKASCSLLKPGGIMFVATLNRTVKSYALAIIGAEYIMRWLPVGTHDWNKFLQPAEIESYISRNGLHLEKLQGLSYNPLASKWRLSEDLDVNYMVVCSKK